MKVGSFFAKQRIVWANSNKVSYRLTWALLLALLALTPVLSFRYSITHAQEEAQSSATPAPVDAVALKQALLDLSNP